MAYFNLFAMESTNTETEMRFVVSVDASEVREKSKKVIYLEQWMVSTFTGKKRNIVRVRKTTSNGNVSYEMTVKSKPVQKGNTVTVGEYNVKIDEEMFEGFKAMALVGVIKERHIISSEGLDFEVDIYQGHEEGTVFATVEVEFEEGEKVKRPTIPLHSATIVTNLKQKNLIIEGFNIKNEGVSINEPK